MPSERYIKIGEDGKVSSVLVESSDRTITPENLSLMAGKVPVRIRKAFSIDESPCDLVSIVGTVYASIRLHHLPIRSSFYLGQDGIMRPLYRPSSDTGTDNPVITASWTVPPDMKLVFASRLYARNDGKWSTSGDHANLLVAWHSGRSYLLPMPNLFDNGDVCTGEFEGLGGSIQEAFAKALAQFKQSSWNTDLLDVHRDEGSDALFLFKLTKEGLETIPMTVDWVPFCKKISSSVIEAIGEPLP